MAQLATLDDVAAVGGVAVDLDETSAEGVRAARLIELASGAVLTFFDGFNVAEADIEEWDEFRKDALASLVAEIAVKRLNVSGAPNVDPYTTDQGPQTLKLNRWEKRSLRDLVPPDEDDELEWVKP